MAGQKTSKSAKIFSLEKFRLYGILSSPDHITAGAYNRNIDKRLARNLVWPRETSRPVGATPSLCVREYTYE